MAPLLIQNFETVAVGEASLKHQRRTTILYNQANLSEGLLQDVLYARYLNLQIKMDAILSILSAILSRQV
jgi:hypothetical protein